MKDGKLPGWASTLIIVAAIAAILILYYFLDLIYPFPLWLTISAGVVFAGILVSIVVSGYRSTLEQAKRELNDCLLFSGLFLTGLIFLKYYMRLDEFPLDHPYAFIHYAVGVCCAPFIGKLLLGLGMVMRRFSRGIGFNLILLCVLSLWCYELALFSRVRELELQSNKQSTAVKHQDTDPSMYRQSSSKP